MPEVDAKLARSLKQAKSTPMFFAFVAKGATDGALIVSKKKIPVKEINEAKETCGGKLVFKGRCTGEDGKIVFEIVKEPPGTLAKQVKTIIHRDAGLTMMVEFRQASDAEDEGEDVGPAEETDSEAAPIPSAPPLPPQDGTAVMARLNALAGPIKAALAGPNAARVQALFVAVNGQVKSKDFIQAAKLLDELEPLVKPAPAPDGAAVTSRLNALTGPIKAALTGPNAARVQALFVAVNGQIKSKDFDQASRSLDELEPLLVQAPPAPPPPPEGGTAVISRLNALAGPIKTALAGPNAQQVQALFVAVNGQVKNKDFVQAARTLDELEPLVKASAPAPKQSPIVAMQSSRLRWDQTRKQVQVDLQSLEKEILAECKAINDDPKEEEEIDLAELAGKTKILYTILDKLDERLMDKLDEALNSKTPEARQQKQSEAVGIIKEYQATVGSDPLLAKIDNSGFFNTSIKQTFTNVLNDLASKL